MERADGATPDLTQENIDKLAELFPDVITEDIDADGNVVRAVDFDALRDDLSGSVVEGRRERYQFTWPGKAKAKLEARTPTSKTMRPCPEKSIDWDTTENLYIEGDNLEALKIMRETYAGKVKLIYIDPPYNTGHDFIYDDDFAESHAEYAAESGEYDEEGGRLVTNTESNGRFHSDWCSMMYPRLLLARDLLKNDGAIFISIDDNESMNLRKICDEVFGALCFAGDISWQKTYAPKNNNLGITTEVEHLLVYSKMPGWLANRLPRTEEMDSKYKNPDNDFAPWRTDNSSAPGAISHQGMVYAIQSPFSGEMLYPPKGRCWSREQSFILECMNKWAHYELRDLHDESERAEVCNVSATDVRKGVMSIVLSEPLEKARKSAERLMAEGPWPLFYFTAYGRGGIARKTYLDAVQGRSPTNYWPNSEVGHTDEAKKGLKALFDDKAPFDTPKPVRLMMRILDIASEKDSLVLDFFSGSASMAHAVLEKNADDGGSRRFILVQIPEKATGDYDTLCEIGEERIRRAGAKIRSEIERSIGQPRLGEEPKPLPDFGFRVLRIDDAVLRNVNADPASTSQTSLLDLIDNLEEGAGPLDLLFQVLPKFRIPYSCKIEERDVDGRTVLDANGGQLLACFDEDVSTATVEAIAKARPVYAVFRDSSFADDSAVANLEELFKTFSPDTIYRVI